MTAKKATTARPTQAGLPGTQGAIAEIEQLADQLLARREDVAEAKRDEGAAEAALIRGMKQRRRKVYKRRMPDGSVLDVSITESKEHARCRKTKTKSAQE